MGQFKFKNKNIDYKKKGDKIEVKLMNEDYQVFYKKTVSIKDKKGIEQLRKDLSDYGIDLGMKKVIDWFDI